MLISLENPIYHLLGENVVVNLYDFNDNYNNDINVNNNNYNNNGEEEYDEDNN